MCLPHVVDMVFKAIIAKNSTLLFNSFSRAILYLAANARRAHPKRDRITGRLAT